MKGKRRRHDPEFKARVAIEALKNIKTASQIAKEFQIHPAQVSDWKKQMLDGVIDLFASHLPDDLHTICTNPCNHDEMPFLTSRQIKALW